MLAQNTFIFPFTVLPESYYKFVSLILPSVKILRIMRPACIPEWNIGEFEEHPVFLNEEHIRKAQEIYRGYQDYAKIHGEKHLLETLSLKRIDSEWEESRLRLRSIIKSGSTNEPSDEWVANLEAALILELARDLDQKDIELDRDLIHIDILESKFRQALGLDEEEGSAEIEEPIKITAEALPRRSYFGYLLSKRISSWLRLFVLNPTNTPPLLLCVTREIIEELADPFRTRIERDGREWIWSEHSIISIPNFLEFIDIDTFKRIRSEVMQFDRTALWNIIDSLVSSPENEEIVESLKREAQKLEAFIKDIITAHTPKSFDAVPRIELLAYYSPQLNLSRIIEHFIKKKPLPAFDVNQPFLVINEVNSNGV